MPEPQADALIDQLRRANRRWKGLALGALAALVFTSAGLATFATVQVGREKAAAEAALAEAEQARQETKEALAKAEHARRRAEWLLYASQIQLAEQAWGAGEGEKKKR